MRHLTHALYFCLALFFGSAIILIGSIFGTHAYDSGTVSARLNITQNLPIIYSMKINYGMPINLTPGSTYQVICNVTVVNYNGWDDIERINATFFRANGTGANGFGLFGDHDNNSRYHTECVYANTIDPFVFSFNCTFNVTYHAFPGQWNCTTWLNNTLNTPINGTNASTVLPLYALNITDVIDYGDMAVYETSGVRSVNVTNWGNMPINLTLYGFGGTTNSTGNNLSFMCPDGYSTNISVDNARWTLHGDIPWANMINLTSYPVRMNNLTIYKQSTDANIWNTTYWKLYVPPNPFGACNGTLVYEAMAY